jgi:type III secretion protein J
MAMGSIRLPAGSWRLLRLSVLPVVLLLCGCNVDLYSKLPEREANVIVALLLRNNIAADRVEAKDGSSTVRVEQGGFAQAVGLLNAAGLPRAKFQTMGEIFANEGLVASPTEERARFIYALNQELSRTVSDIDGVVSARVHVVLPKNDPLRMDQTPSSAAVFIKYDQRTQVTALLPQIKTLISNSVEGLTYDKVSVVFVPSENQEETVRALDLAKPGIADAGSSPFRALSLLVAGLACALLLAGGAVVWIRRRAASLNGGSWNGADISGDRTKEPLDATS